MVAATREIGRAANSMERVSMSPPKAMKSMVSGRTASASAGLARRVLSETSPETKLKHNYSKELQADP